MYRNRFGKRLTWWRCSFSWKWHACVEHTRGPICRTRVNGKPIYLTIGELFDPPVKHMCLRCAERAYAIRPAIVKEMFRHEVPWHRNEPWIPR